MLLPTKGYKLTVYVGLDFSKEMRCPYNVNLECAPHAEHIKMYAQYLVGLAAKGGTDIFTSGGHDDMVCDHKCPVWQANNKKTKENTPGETEYERIKSAVDCLDGITEQQQNNKVGFWGRLFGRKR